MVYAVLDKFGERYTKRDTYISGIYNSEEKAWNNIEQSLSAYTKLLLLKDYVIDRIDIQRRTVFIHFSSKDLVFYDSITLKILEMEIQ